MFNIFASRTFQDPTIGLLVRSRGYWRGEILISGTIRVPLILSGARSKPEESALREAKNIPVLYDEWQPLIENALFDHYQPYGGEGAGDDSMPIITDPQHVWDRTTLLYIAVTPLGGVLTTEAGYSVGWDEEHTLGIRFQQGTFLELCGSVVMP